MIRIELLLETDPAKWADRACKDIGTDAFFPGRGSRAEQAVKQVCAGCDRLRECAEWALEAGLTYCVVAGVRMPGDGRRRTHADEQLRAVVATGVVPGLSERGRGVAA